MIAYLHIIYILFYFRETDPILNYKNFKSIDYQS